MCVLGKRLLKDVSISDCHKNDTGPLHKMYCLPNSTICEEYYRDNPLTVVNGIKGLSSGVLMGT